MLAIKAAQGSLGAYLLAVRATGHGLSITLWDNQASAQAHESSSSYREQVAKVARYFSAPPSVASYDVTAHTEQLFVASLSQPLPLLCAPGYHRGGAQ